MSSPYVDACAADTAWQAELVRLFGKRAGDVRYTSEGRGDPGSVLRSLHDEFVRATAALRASWSRRCDHVQA